MNRNLGLTMLIPHVKSGQFLAAICVIAFLSYARNTFRMLYGHRALQGRGQSGIYTLINLRPLQKFVYIYARMDRSEALVLFRDRDSSIP